MKKIFILCLFFIFSFTLHATSIVNPNDPPTDEIMIPIGDGTFVISLNDYIQLSPKVYREITGQKLTFKERIKLKLTQAMLKKAIRNKTFVDKEDFFKRGLFDPWSWHWGGFALGFFFSLLGVVVALFINDDYRHDRIMTALCAAGIAAGILVAIAAATSAP